jgi:hypothetical protein
MAPPKALRRAQRATSEHLKVLGGIECVLTVVISTASTPGCGARDLLPLTSIVVDGWVRSAAPPTREAAHILKKRHDSTGAAT